MKDIMTLTLLTCVCLQGQAQVNFVKNCSFERYDTCPYYINGINWCKDWSMPGDSTTVSDYCPEYFNICGNKFPEHITHVPDNVAFYNYPHSEMGMAGGHFYYDKTPPGPPTAGLLPFNYRDYFVGRLHRNLILGKSYCVSFWVIMAEASGVAHNRIGAYLDDGSINIVDTLGQEIVHIKPQVFSNLIISDTLHWTKIEGVVTANGIEKYISIGNFFPNDSVATMVTNYRFLGTQYSYYLIDDVSVIPIDLDADAGKDSHAEPGKSVQIGRIGDTTALGLDCKWYSKGLLIDSGAVISVNGAAIVGTVDTYVVVQTICGLIKTDTVTVTTVPLGMKIRDINKPFTVYPNPSNGNLTIETTSFPEMTQAKVFDLLGRLVHQQKLLFSDNKAILNTSLSKGIYILELVNHDVCISRERIIIK
jgi:Secretion system C-terminal sorting domain